MRIINLQQLRQQPEGVVFCKYEPQIFGELEIFGGVCGEDFVSAPLVACPLCSNSNEHADILDNAEKTGESFKLDVEGFGRDGLFEDNQLFAIYEKEDLIQLVRKLTESINKLL